MTNLAPRRSPLLLLSALTFTSAALAGCGGTEQGQPHSGKGIFEAANPWTKDVSGLDKEPSSDSIIGWLADNGGWGAGEMRIDFSLVVLGADDATEKRDFEPTEDF